MRKGTSYFRAKYDPSNSHHPHKAPSLSPKLLTWFLSTSDLQFINKETISQTHSLMDPARMDREGTLTHLS